MPTCFSGTAMCGQGLVLYFKPFGGNCQRNFILNLRSNPDCYFWQPKSKRVPQSRLLLITHSIWHLAFGKPFWPFYFLKSTRSALLGPTGHKVSISGFYFGFLATLLQSLENTTDNLVCFANILKWVHV